MHTYASDGKPSVAEIAWEARRKGLRQINISDHSFTNFICHMTRKKFEEQSAAIEVERDGELQILQGIEGNLLDPKGNMDVPDDIIRRLDVLTVGFHRFLSLRRVIKHMNFINVNGFGSRFLRQKLIEVNTRAFISAMEKYPVDIIAHLGHRTLVDFARVCQYAAEHDVYVELNVKHLDTIEEGINDALGTPVKFIVGSDAHTADKIGEFSAVENFIVKHGIPLERVYGIDGNIPTFKDKKEWHK